MKWGTKKTTTLEQLFSQPSASAECYVAAVSLKGPTALLYTWNDLMLRSGQNGSLFGGYYRVIKRLGQWNYILVFLDVWHLRDRDILELKCSNPAQAFITDPHVTDLTGNHRGRTLKFLSGEIFCRLTTSPEFYSKEEKTDRRGRGEAEWEPEQLGKLLRSKRFSPKHFPQQEHRLCAGLVWSAESIDQDYCLWSDSATNTLAHFGFVCRYWELC